jgi:hypothetical protein
MCDQNLNQTDFRNERYIVKKINLDSVTWLDGKRRLALNQTIQLMAKVVCQSFKIYVSIIQCIQDFIFISGTVQLSVYHSIM